MIVQEPAGDHAPFVITPEAHQALAGQLAAAIGNHSFAPLDPAELHRVPAASGGEVTISLAIMSPGVLKLCPFPFVCRRLGVTSAGRYVPVRPTRAREELRDALRQAEISTQHFALLEGP